MEANDTGKTKIKVVGNIFRLTFVFNALKTPLNLCLNSLQILSLFLIFEIRGVISFKTCLEGGNLVNLNMHAPRCIMGCPYNIFYQTTCKVQAWGGAAKALFTGISWMHVRRGSMKVTQSENIKWKEQ
jgi:hypothetical protein